MYCEVLDHGKVELVQHMGSDLTVVNAARVSFDKESAYEVKLVQVGDGDTDIAWVPSLSERDQKLIKYLAKHNHWTPFGHTSLTFRIKAPIFVARQLGKHQVGLVWNEVSRRYVDTEPDFYFPKMWREAAENVKQGSLDQPVADNGWVKFRYENFIERTRFLYETILDAGVAPEMARMILPQSTFTEWIWTGSLAAFARVYKLRSDPHAQKETREYAEAIKACIPEDLRYSWEALCEPS
jgi:thymidylate synthase (FAD)